MLSISRSEAQEEFSGLEIALLTKLAPLVNNAIDAHLEAVGNIFGEADIDYRPALLQKRLDQFGLNRLTEREHQIVHLMLLGHSSKALANYLEISPETERTHRKNIYRKMDINSHAELLASAFEFLLGTEQ